VAVELGYIHGSVYTSLTGARTENGSGTVQLLSLVKLLQKDGMKMWDLGMAMSYKEEIGATKMPRTEFLSLYRRFAAETPRSRDPLRVQPCANAREILDDPAA